MEKIGFGYSRKRNYPPTMLNRTQMLRIFCAAAEAPSFREAAARLGCSPQSVTRAVRDLEELLGEPLFHRNTRQIRITAYGEQLARQARDSLSALDRLFRRGGQADEMAGRVGLTAPQAIGRRYLLPLLQPLLREHPQLRVELRLDDEPTDAVAAQIDIGVRVGFIRDRRYIARAAAKVPFYVVASPALLAECGAPEDLDALARRPLSALIDRQSGRPWPWLFAAGRQLLAERPAFTCDDPDTELQAVLAGLAFAQLPGYLAVPHLRSGELVAVLGEHAPPPWELFLYRPQRGPVAPRVRRVFDHLLQRFADPQCLPVTP